MTTAIRDFDIVSAADKCKLDPRCTAAILAARYWQEDGNPLLYRCLPDFYDVLEDVIFHEDEWDDVRARNQPHVAQLRKLANPPKGLTEKNVWYAMYHIQHFLSNLPADMTEETMPNWSLRTQQWAANQLIVLYCCWSMLFGHKIKSVVAPNDPGPFKKGTREQHPLLFARRTILPGLFLRSFSKKVSMSEYRLSTVANRVAYGTLLQLSEELCNTVDVWINDAGFLEHADTTIQEWAATHRF